MDRQNVSSGIEWEPKGGYSWAVRVGDEVHVSGTTATDEDGNLVGAGDPYEQTKQTLENVVSALEEVGTSVKDVIRTRIYVTDIDQGEEVGRAR